MRNEKKIAILQQVIIKSIKRSQYLSPFITVWEFGVYTNRRKIHWLTSFYRVVQRINLKNSGWSLRNLLTSPAIIS